MAEAGDAGARVGALAPGQRPARAEPRLDERLRARRIADLEQHRQHVLVGAAVARALQRRDGGGDRGVQVGQRGDGHARRERRRVQLVVGVKSQHEVQHPRDLRGRLASLEQIEEVRGVPEVRAARPPARGRSGCAATPPPWPGTRLISRCALRTLASASLARVSGSYAAAQRHRRAERVERVAVARQ